MMADERGDRVAITRSDLQSVAELVLARFEAAEAEQLRIRRVARLLALTSELHKALGEYTRFALVDHRGTHGSNDLAAATEALYQALENYASEVRELNQDFVQLDIRCFSFADDLQPAGAIERAFGNHGNRIRSA
jgi:hypothetical protein